MFMLIELMFSSTNIQPIDQHFFPLVVIYKFKMAATDDKIVNNRHVFVQK